MSSMSPCCVVLTSNAVGSSPLSQLQQYGANSILIAALASFKGTSCFSPAFTDSDFFPPLVELSNSPIVTTGTVSELASYKDWVKSRIQATAALASESRVWRESGVVQKLQRAMALVDSGFVNKGRDVACELLGFNQLKSLATSSLQLTWNSAIPAGGCNNSVCSSAVAGSDSLQFKVPALPAKRCRLQLEQQLQVSDSEQAHEQQSGSHAMSQQQQEQQQRLQHRKHSAPKRRATPQVLPAAPFVLGSAAAPDSTAHGETCCDETLLSCWCPISGKRQRSLQMDSTGSPSSSNSSSGSPQQQLQRQASPPSAAISNSAVSSTTPPAGAADFAHEASTTTTSAPTGGLSAAAAVQASAAASRAASNAEAVVSLKRLLHEDPSHSKPSSDVLLFSKAHQQPIHNWTGTIKHRSNGRAVEVCRVTLQVPEPFLEEFPATLYAADIRHRRSVSLGRHVVCRATLGSVSEHQLAGLSAMARGQLVALCTLQTAELHLVPYFDNKNLVRMVGFLKIKAE